MGMPAARIGDMHVCPLVTPGVPPIPHVGGPISMGKPNVMIGNMPAATATSMCVCVGPPDTIIKGSTGVMIGGMPAARLGDTTAHGGSIVVGLPTVMIGEINMGALVAAIVIMPAIIVPEVIAALPKPTAKAVILASALMMAAIVGSAMVHNECSCPQCQ